MILLILGSILHIQATLRRSNVLYQIDCSCGELGQTQRNLATRLNDHNQDGCKYQSTDVTNHLMETNDHYIDFENVTVLFQASNWRKLLIKETLYYMQQKQPQLNVDKSSLPLYLFNM